MGIEIRAIWRAGEGAGQDPGCASWLVGREEAVREQGRVVSGRRVAFVSVSGGCAVGSKAERAVGSKAFACIGGGRPA